MKFHLRWHRSRPESVQPVFHRDWPKKQDYPCCAATRDAYNRPDPEHRQQDRARADEAIGMTTTGLCECGCGEATRIAPQSVTKKGIVKGQHMRFRPGHQHRGKPETRLQYGAPRSTPRSPKPSDSGSPDLRAALDRQLRQLRSWEDPADTSSIAVVYRDMLDAAKATALAGGRDVRGWGEYGACRDDRKRHRAAS